jgi:hypothetical protein
MSAAVASWLTSFTNSLQSRDVAMSLRQAAQASNLREWTRLLTSAVVLSCNKLDWPTAARGHRLIHLPQPGQEYLGMDVMAFRPHPDVGSVIWPFPIAVFELENAKRREGYSLWKVICVRAELRVVFSYRNDWNQVQALVQSLKRDVIDGYSIPVRQALGDGILLVTGSRGEGETFPYGYFKIWRLNPNTGSFERITNWG